MFLFFGYLWLGVLNVILISNLIFLYLQTVNTFLVHSITVLCDIFRSRVHYLLYFINMRENVSVQNPTNGSYLINRKLKIMA